MALTAEWLTMPQAAEHVGARWNGKPTWDDTVRRWCLQGLRGIRLRSQLRGGRRMTKVAWMEEFFEAIDALRSKGGDADGEDRRPPVAVSPKKEAAEKKRVRSELRAMGMLP